MKLLVVVLASLFVVLQYKLWFERGGVAEVQRLKQAIAVQTQENQQLMQRNSVLAAEVSDLKSGQAAIEAHARNDLGMIRPSEVFYQVVEKNN
jgi:cell division protein FtsB